MRLHAMGVSFAAVVRVGAEIDQQLRGHFDPAASSTLAAALPVQQHTQRASGI
jgi:hypothetical protein